VAVARIDFLKTVFGGGGKVQGVGSAKKGGGRSVAKDILDAQQHSVGNVEGVDESVGDVGSVLGKGNFKRKPRQRTIAQFPM